MRLTLWSLFSLVFCLAVSAHGQIYRYEAEDGNLVNTVFSNSVSGYSGTGYVTSFENNDPNEDYFELYVDVPAGVYEMWVGYRSQYGNKGYDYQVDGEFGSGTFTQSSVFTEDRAGLFSVSAGVNTLGIYEGWGYYDVDYLEFRPYTPPTLSPVPPVLNNPLAESNTQVLMNYLASQYGSKTLSGQHHEQSKNLSFPVQDYLTKSGGIVPAIRSSDFIQYSPTRIEYGGDNTNNESEQSIAWAQQTGGVVSMMWHWNAPANLVNTPCGNQCGPDDYPWWRGFYSPGTMFDLPGALADPNGSDYQLLLRDIDAIAMELQKFEDAGVPVIWHPLHEAQGGWFWWGDHGPDAFKDLWGLMHDRLTNYHGLNNLIWEYVVATGTAQGFSPDWYPGDDLVDMIGLDIYTDPTSSMSEQWSEALGIYDGNKMIALSETGTLPNPDLMDQWGIEWSYFSPWKGTFVDDMDPATLQAVLNHEDIIILDELPVLPWKSNATFLSADFDFDGDVDEVDLATWQAAYGASAGGDADFNGITDGTDFLLWQQQYTGPGALGASPATVPEPTTLVLMLLASTAVVGRRHYWSAP